MKRVEYSHGFSSVFFFDTPEVTKIVLPKVLQKFKKTPNCTCWPKELSQKGFPRNIQYQTRPKGPFSFFGIVRLFSDKKFFPQRVPLQLFRKFCDRMDVEKSQRVPLSIFLALWDFFPIFFIEGSPIHQYFDIFKSFCSVWALDMAPTWAGSGLLELIWLGWVTYFSYLFLYLSVSCYLRYDSSVDSPSTYQSVGCGFESRHRLIFLTTRKTSRCLVGVLLQIVGGQDGDLLHSSNHGHQFSRMPTNNLTPIILESEWLKIDPTKKQTNS